MKESTIEEAKSKLGDFLVMKEQDGIQLGLITDMNIEERPEFTFDYLKDGMPAFTISIFKPTESVVDIGLSSEERLLIFVVKRERRWRLETSASYNGMRASIVTVLSLKILT